MDGRVDGIGKFFSLHTMKAYRRKGLVWMFSRTEKCLATNWN